MLGNPKPHTYAIGRHVTPMGHRHGPEGPPRRIRPLSDNREGAGSAALPAFKAGAGDKRESAFRAVACISKWPKLGG